MWRPLTEQEQQQRVAKIREARAAGEWGYYFESIPHSKRPEVLRRVSNEMSDLEYWYYVRQFWLSNCHGFSETLCALLEANRLFRQSLMLRHEHEAFNRLSQTLTVFRGCGSTGEKLGWSWTLSEKVARRFGLLRGDDAFVLRGNCRKSDVLAYFERPINEAEVVVKPENVTWIRQRSVRPYADYSSFWEPLTN